MSVFFLSAPPSISTVTHRSTATTITTRFSSLQTLPQPLPPQPLVPTSLSQPSSSNILLTNPKASPASSSGCSLNCPHFDSCSGCTHEDNLHRPVILHEATMFFKKHGVSDFTFDTCRLWGWRCRAKLAIRGSSTDPLIGLYEEGTHNVVNIPDCKAHHPSINAAVELLRKGVFENSELIFTEMHKVLMMMQVLSLFSGIKILHIDPYDEDERTGYLRYVQVIFGNRWRHILGERDFWEHVGGIDVYLPPSSFGQANTRAFDSLLQKLHKYVPVGSSVTDLYAGAGVIGLSLASARKCRKGICVEINKESKLAFEKTIERLPSSIDSSISWHHADTSIEPLSWLVGSDILVVDPPRKGLDPSLIGALRDIKSAERKAMTLESPIFKTKDEKRPWILRARENSIQIPSRTLQEENLSLPQTLIYISCGWESFKENCVALLSSNAWHLTKAHGFNFFPGTQSIEILAVFKRGPGASVKKKKPGKRKKNDKLSFKGQ
ncbi:hypothetical protein E3N88_02734 [Mikania micrantha]|uniref:Methyltransferase small domain-containing protein n=1 Tax=Mikania micrantha TaxID=192012 RepID=A0A5N6Q6V2_9ASTR|nr:hypothetical protein E3N88_02734 [Mikania micrantha]